MISGDLVNLEGIVHSIDEAEGKVLISPQGLDGMADELVDVLPTEIRKTFKV